ncbi:response regulator [Pseudomonas syringae]|uniref:response regulator n=1 Tax=Pseudomonas TaxID=286 RepID=UPI0013C31D23|nr:response regulator [Pseudomonas syringae]
MHLFETKAIQPISYRAYHIEDRTMDATILLVEDDDTLRMVTADARSLLEANVIECHSADQAVAVLESGALIQLLITDIRMPGSMDGLQLAGLVAFRWPGLDIIVTSGNRLPTEVLPEKALFMAKPWTLSDLLQRVRPLLPGSIANSEHNLVVGTPALREAHRYSTAKSSN